MLFLKKRALAAALLLMYGLMLGAHAEDFSPSGDPSAPISALTRLTSLQNTHSDIDIKTPQVTQFFTKNGAKVLFVASPELPMVDIRLTFDAGAARDSDIRPGLFGLASLTAQLLDEGTSTQSADDIAATFEQLGAEYSAGSYRDMFTVDLRSLVDADKLQPAVKQLVAVITDAQFPQASLDRIFKNASIGQQQREESPGTMASIQFYKTLYGTHPYAEPPTGTRDSLLRITPSDIRAFKQKFLVANNLTIALTGQLNLAQATALAEQLTQAMPSGEHAPKLPTPSAVMQPQTINVPFNASQSHVIIGALGISHSDPDIVPLTVGNELLGGGDFNAQLMKDLREKRGLTYGAYSGFSAMRSLGPFTINFSTRSDQTAESIAVAKQTLSSFLNSPIDPVALGEVKNSMLRSFPLSLASNQAILGYLSMMGFYDLPTTYLQDYVQAIKQVTPEQVSQALNKKINPNALVTVVVGAHTDNTQAVPAK